MGQQLVLLTECGRRIFFGRIKSLSGGIHVEGDLLVAHRCAVMCNPADGDWQPMKTLSFTEFRKRASEILTLVEKGETVIVIRHGKIVAKSFLLKPRRTLRHGRDPA